MIENFRARVLRKIRWIWKVYLSRLFIVALLELRRMARAPILVEGLGAVRYAVVPPTGYVPHNTSILQTPEGWLLAVRAGNFQVGENGNDVGGGPQNLDAETWLVRLNDRLAVTEARRLVEAPHRDLNGPARNGLADPRLFLWQQQLWAIWTAEMFPVNDWASARNVMALGRIEDGRLAQLEFLRSPYGCLREKNWMPWVRDGKLLFVYQINPLEVYEFANGRLQLLHKATRKHLRLRNYSGSSQLVPWGDDWICVVHYAARATYATVTRRCHYMHRFVILSNTYEVKAVSREFFIEARTTEFCAGLAVTEQHVLLSYGLCDREPRVATIERKNVAGLF